MKKILFINACVRPESRTYLLASEVLKQMEGVVEEVNLAQADITPLSWKGLQERDRCVRDQNYTSPMFQYAKPFITADGIVIAAPYWDLSFPPAVRIYLEAVTINGLSFMYTPEGYPAGLCKAQKLIYVTTAGGTIGEHNFGYEYLKTLAQTFYGIPKTYCFKAENLDIKGSDVRNILEKAMIEIRSKPQLFSW